MRFTAFEITRAPLDRVFDVFTDIEHCAGRIKGIKKVEVLSAVRSGKGLRWRETRSLFGKDADAVKEITAFTPPLSFRVESRVDGTNYVSTFDFHDDSDGLTHVTWTHDSVALTTGARFMSPLLFLFKGMMVKHMKKDLADLAEFLKEST